MLACQESKAQSELQEKGGATEACDGARLSCKCNLKCQKLRARRLPRWDKVNLTHLKKLNLVLWAELHGAQGGAELEQWVDELLYLDHGINPPKRPLRPPRNRSTFEMLTQASNLA